MSLHYKGIIHKARISDILKYFRLHFGFALQKQMVLPLYRNHREEIQILSVEKRSFLCHRSKLYVYPDFLKTDIIVIYIDMLNISVYDGLKER